MTFLTDALVDEMRNATSAAQLPDRAAQNGLVAPHPDFVALPQ